MKYRPHTLLMFVSLCLVSQSLIAQAPAREVLKQKAQEQLGEIIRSSSSITGFMAIDLTGDDSFGINENMVFAQASAIKIPILMEVYKQAHEKKFDLSDEKTLTAENTVGGSGILVSMSLPLRLTVKNLGYLMIAMSDNSATNMLIDLVGMQSINETMRSLGMNNTRVQRKMIDQAASIRNEENISTPAEAVKLMKLLYEGKFVSKQVSDEILSVLMRNPRANSKLARSLPRNVRIAFKPGGMGGVSTEWAVIYLANKPYALAVMDNYRAVSDPGNAFEDISSVLYNYYFKASKATKYGVILE